MVGDNGGVDVDVDVVDLVVYIDAVVDVDVEREIDVVVVAGDVDEFSDIGGDIDAGDIDVDVDVDAGRPKCVVDAPDVLDEEVDTDKGDTPLPFIFVRMPSFGYAELKAEVLAVEPELDVDPNIISAIGIIQQCQATIRIELYKI